MSFKNTNKLKLQLVRDNNFLKIFPFSICLSSLILSLPPAYNIKLEKNKEKKRQMRPREHTKKAA